MKFTQIPTDLAQNIQINAGILLTSFTPSTPTITNSNIIGATSGGINFKATPSYVDFGEDIDNCPKNTKELMQLDDWDVVLSGNFISIVAATAKKLAGAADVDGTDTTKVVPRSELAPGDFADLWLVGDYSDKNGATNGGYVAIHMINSLSTGGFQIQTGDKKKGTFAFEFKGHKSINTPTVVPFEIYVKAGTAEPTT